MTNKSATMELLDTVPIGKRFYSLSLCRTVRDKTGNKPFVSTCLRYLREWNTLQDNKKAVCIDKGKSMYRIEGREG